VQLRHGPLPVKGAKLSEPAEISLVGSDQPDAQSPRAHSGQCVIFHGNRRGQSVVLPNATSWKRGTQVLENMVDLAGIEPATSSMPWKLRTCRPLILKEFMTGGMG
jgi:hypothetical protein